MISITKELADGLIKTIRDSLSDEWYRYTDNYLTAHSEESFYKRFYKVKLHMIEELQAAINAEQED